MERHPGSFRSVTRSTGWRMVFRGTTACFALLLAAACSDTRDPVGVQAPGDPVFSVVTAPDLVLAGGAVLLDEGFRLSGPDTTQQVGAAWHTVRQRLNEGFENEFTFQLTPDGLNATDGFAFVVQGSAADTIGSGAFAYEGLANSLAVVFDTRAGSEISVRTGGSLAGSLGSATLASALNDGQEQTALVVYANGVLAVSVNGVHVLSTPVDLGLVAGVMDFDGYAWVGFTASSGLAVPGQTHDITAWTFRDSDSPYPAAISVGGPPGIPGVTAVATNVATGEFFVGITDSYGVAALSLVPGNYILSAYRFGIPDALQLVVWPSVLNDQTNAGLPAYTPVIWHPTDGSLLKTPANLLKALEAPAGIGPGTVRTFALSFGQGATVQCTLLDENGNPLRPDDDEWVFGITPLPEHPSLPPRFRPDGFPWTNQQLASLPRGIAFGTAEIASGVGGGCVIPGAPEGKVIIESEPVTKNGKTFVYRASRVVAGSGTVLAVAGPSPEMVESHWHHDELIRDPFDPTGPTDFGGAIVYGWEKGASLGSGYYRPSDRFVVSSQFMGQGTYTLELWKGAPGNRAPDVVIKASCSAKKCSMASNSVPRGSGIGAGVTGVSSTTAGVRSGTVVWSVDWPSLVSATLDVGGSIVGSGDVLWFRIYGGSANNPSDTLAPGTEYLSAEKRPGRAQSYLLASTM